MNNRKEIVQLAAQTLLSVVFVGTCIFIGVNSKDEYRWLFFGMKFYLWVITVVSAVVAIFSGIRWIKLYRPIKKITITKENQVDGLVKQLGKMSDPWMLVMITSNKYDTNNAIRKRCNEEMRRECRLSALKYRDVIQVIVPYDFFKVSGLTDLVDKELVDEPLFFNVNKGKVYRTHGLRLMEEHADE